MAEVKWIKLKIDMFDDDKIKLLQSMPEGDALIVIWVRLLTLAGKTNDNGYVYMSEDLPYTEEMLSILFNKNISVIRMALQTLEQLKMIDPDVKGIYLINFDKHQSISKLEDIKEYNRKAQQASREKRKLLLENVNDKSMTCQPCQGTDIEKEIDKELDKNKNKEHIVEIVNYLNTVCLTSYKSNSSQNKQLINARLRDGFKVDDFKTVIDTKFKEWQGTDFAKYLKPSTLFSAKHFEDYLNQGGKRNGKSNSPGQGTMGTVQQTTDKEDDVERALRKAGRTIHDIKISTDVDF